MALIVDSLVVELGLDASKFTLQQREALEAAQRLERNQEKAAKNIEYAAGKAGNAISGVRTQALEMLAVLTGGTGLVAFGVNMTHANAQLGRLERNLGISASTISKWQGLARIMGGDAASMAQSFTQVSDAFAGWKFGITSPLIADLRAISTAGGKIIDVNKGVEQSFIDLAENMKAIHDRDPAQAGLLGRRLGLAPEFVDALIKGPAALQQILDYVKKIGVATKDDTDAFGELEKRIAQMGLKGESLGRKLLGGKDGGASKIMQAADILNLTPGQIWENLTTTGTWLGKKSTEMFPAPAGAPSGGGSNPAWRNAIAAIESRGSGGYAAVGPTTRSGDRAYGKYQIMGNNIGDWSQAATGKRMSIEEFMASPDAQDKIFDHRFGQYVKQFGNPQDAASAWLTGKPLSQGANRRDLYGTSGAEYVRRFNAEGGSSNSSTEINVNGPITITPPAGAQPDAWASSFVDALKKQSKTAQANTGAQ